MGDNNYLSCPLGVLFLLSTLLGSGGARGNTGQQIAKALRLHSSGTTVSSMTEMVDESKALYDEIYQSLTTERTYIDNKQVPVISVATGAFIQKGIGIQPRFRWSAQNEFKCTIEELDFKNQSVSAGIINGWVNSGTHGLIPRFFRVANEIPPDTRLVIINVLYFKDQWQKQFTLASTTVEEFALSAERTIKIPMMNSVENVQYGKFDDYGFQMISKDFKNDRFSFVVLLPMEMFQLSGVEQVLNGRQKLSQLMSKLQETTVSLKLPKFKIEQSMNLMRTLEAMNVLDLFRLQQADLTGITVDERLYVKLFKQSSVLKVDEAGVEAAAVTGAVAVPMSAVFTDIEFYVTHPFVCFIYDNSLQMPLFAARILEPK